MLDAGAFFRAVKLIASAPIRMLETKIKSTREDSMAEAFIDRGQMKQQRRARVAALFVALTTAPTGVALPQEDFYHGKTVRLIVGQPAGGGGSNTYGRIISRHLGKHIPGSPFVNMENMAGAGSLVAANYVSNVGAQDGLIIGVVGVAIPFSPMLGVKEAQFDATKLNWLPSPVSDVSGLTLWHASPVNSIADARRHELVLATANPFSTSSFYARIMTEILGVKFKLINGYNGVEPAYLAMERGEVEGHPSASRAGLKSTHPDWIRDRKVKIIVQYGRAPSPELPDVPFLRDEAKTDADRQLVDVAVAPLSIGWPIFLGAKVPADRVAMIRKALLDTYRDPELLAEAAQQGVDFAPNPMTGEDVQQLIIRTYNSPAPVLDRLRALYQAAQ